MRLDLVTRYRVRTIVVATVLYVALSIPLFPYLGQATAALALVPVAVVGALCGVRAGIAAGVVGTLVVTVQIPVGLADLPFWGQIVVRLIGYGGIGAIAGQVHDLGERLRSQSRRLERELDQRQEYTDVVAHELRNPLVAIRAAARAARRDAGEGETARRLEAIAEEAARALGLLDGLNDLSSIESGRMRSVLAPVDIVATVGEAVRGTGDVAERVAVSAPEAPLLVHADAMRIEQVVANLLSNAAKYSPPRSPIEVSVGVSPDVRRAVVTVRDYGPGVPPAERGRLFEKFARLSTAGGTSGSGLGLYISRGIIRDHEGEMQATWPPGGGTEFSFTLPLTSERRSKPR